MLTKKNRMLVFSYRMLQVDIIFMAHVTNIRLRVIRVIRVTSSVQYILSDQYWYMRYTSNICTIKNKLVRGTIYKKA